jgi:GntR family transcriptional regulator
MSRAIKSPRRKASLSTRRGSNDFRLSTAMPIYVQLIMHFRQQIETGKWRVNDTIPTLETLAADFGVTRATVRQAVGFLQREGLLNSRRGRGTTVVGAPRTNLWQQLPDSWAALVESADHIEGDVLELAQPIRMPESPPLEHGKLAGGYHVMRRMLRRDGIPYLVGTSYIDQRIIDDVGLVALKTDSAYRAIALQQRSRPVRGVQTLTLAMADAEIAYLLEIPLSAPIVNVVRWVVDQSDTLIYQSEGQFRSDFVQASRRLR